MKIVFCTTCRNRLTHIQKTLPQNLKDNPRSTFVVLNYNSPDGLGEWLVSDLRSEIESGHLVVYSYFNSNKFRMAHAKNMAHRCGILEGADILVNVDADNLTGNGFEDFIEDTLDPRSRTFLWARMIKGEYTRGISGRIAVPRNGFLESGGYDEAKFVHWGSDDKDFNIRLRQLGYEGIEIAPQYLLGIPHNNKVRFREYPHLSSIDGNCFEVNLGTVTRGVVNGGSIGCGTVYRNDDFSKPILLDRLPTRVFGIGMHKTATASLHHAMGILGFSSWHWSSAHAAKAIWQQMNNLGYSPEIEKYYAACDLPMPLLYWRLDTGYPGSKFILTTRSEHKWLDSVRRHFDAEHNKWQPGWDYDPFTNRVHNLLYGRMDFDAEVFLERYRRHNDEVTEYFRDRPGTLLKMDMDNHTGWFELCSFLGCSVPAYTAYPYVNSSL